MNMTLILLVTILLLWMAACTLCGYRGRFVGFLGVLLAGLTLNMAWMVYGLQAHPFEMNALIAQGLEIEFFHEHSAATYQMFPFLEDAGDGYWKLPPEMPAIPLMFSMRARKGRM